jgi:hypothetical protein
VDQQVEEVGQGIVPAHEPVPLRVERDMVTRCGRAVRLSVASPSEAPWPGRYAFYDAEEIVPPQ